MISSDNLCMSCMREIGDEKICPYCGYHVDSAQISPYLPVRTLVANRYLVGKMLEYNGEGATYIGWDLKEKKAVKLLTAFKTVENLKKATVEEIAAAGGISQSVAKDVYEFVQNSL